MCQANADVRGSRTNRSLLRRVRTYRMDLTRTSHHAVSVWDVYYCGLVSMTLHPGFRKETNVPTLTDLAAIADKMLIERSKICHG